MFGILLFVVCATGTGVHARQVPLADAKSRLELLQQQLLRVGAEGRAEVERRVAEKVDESPKGEFETTKAYETRTAKSSELKSRIQEEVAREQAAKKLDLERRMSEILAARFTLPFEAQLGIYDADAQTFPLTLLPGGLRESVSVPLAEAKAFKENFQQVRKTGVFALHADAQGTAREYLLDASFSYGGKEYHTAPKAMDAARAMYMLYGNYSARAKRSKWNAESEWWEDPADATEALEAIPVFSRQFSEGGVDKFLLVTGSVPEGQEEFGGCHGCGSKMGAVVFARTGGVWGFEAGQKGLGTYGSFGTPPEAGLVRIGNDRQAVALKSGYTGQGITTENLTLLDRVGGVFKEVLSVQISEDTSGYGVLSTPEDNVSYNSRVEYVPGGDAGHWDVRVTSRGSRGVRVGRRMVMRPFSEVKVYKFSGGEYVVSK